MSRLTTAFVVVPLGFALVAALSTPAVAADSECGDDTQSEPRPVVTEYCVDSMHTPPVDLDGDGLCEDVDADGDADFDDADFDDAVLLAFVDYDALTAEQVTQLDFDADGDVDRFDAIEPAFRS
ncbi:MAG: hypothetical protein ACQETI_03360 [Halobacteriota archaeon]